MDREKLKKQLYELSEERNILVFEKNWLIS